MFEAFSRSWEITKLSFKVIWQDKELLLFPVLSFVFSFLLLLGLVVPAFVPVVLQGVGFEAVENMLWYVMLAVFYFGTSFIATFFSVCTVFTTKTRFEGGNATFWQSIQFAISRIHLILVWSLLAATVGLMLHALDRAGERAGKSGELIVKIVQSILGAVWAIITIFVVPVMVYENLGPFAAIKRSIETLRQTWGESLIRYYGLGTVQGLFMFGILVVFFLLTLAGFMISTVLGVVFILTGVMVLIGIGLVFGMANNVFNTALYAYASKRKLPKDFPKELLAGALRKKGVSV